MSKKIIFFFTLYFLLTIGLSTLIHRDVLFNSFNFGRHWDWTFFSFIEMYQNYVRSFFYVIGNDALGTYGSISAGDFIVKGSIILLHYAFGFIPLAILNKIVVFVLFPVISSLGIWHLVRTIGRYIPVKNEFYFFIITLFTNLLYTFSLPVIYDLHGGALNRQISTVALPFFFAYIYRYLKEERSSKYLVWCAALSIFLDISNIFYISVIIAMVVLLKSSSLYAKMKDFSAYAVALFFVSAYWLQSIFLSQAINPAQILSERRLNIDVLKSYSVPFKQLLFLTSSPHNLIETVFKNNVLIYLPALIAIIIILWQIRILSKQAQKNNYVEMVVALCIYIFTSILVSGTYSVGNIYLLLYSFPFLGFIQNSVRFAPNLSLALIFCLLIVLLQNSYYKNRRLLGIISVTMVLWLSFLVINGNLIEKTYTETTKQSSQRPFVLNNEIGSLYKSDPSLLERLEGDKFIGTIVPIPSLTSPIFVNNVYPRTSQGSDTEVEYGKGLLQTSGNTAPAEKYIRSQLTLPSPSMPLQTMNIQYVWINENYMYEDKINLKNHFSNKWLTTILNGRDTPLEKDKRLSTLYKVKNEHLTPVIFADTAEKTKADRPEKNMVVEYKKINDTKYLLVVHNPMPVFNLVLNKQFYPGWKASVVQSDQAAESFPQVDTGTYKVLKPNESTQATVSELKDFIDRGYISSLGDRSEKIMQFHTYKNGLRILSGENRFTIDFVSKMFKNSIQNDNLVESDLSTERVQIPDANHAIFNTYANSWTIDMTKLCTAQPCLNQNDHSLTILLEFKSQTTYQYALFISGVSILVCFLIYLDVFKKRHE